MIFVTNTTLSNYYVFIPILVAIITSIAAPIYLLRRQTSASLSARIIEDGRDIRTELRGRIKTLEERQDQARKEIDEALNHNRELTISNDDLRQHNDSLRQQLEECRRLGRDNK